VTSAPGLKGFDLSCRDCFLARSASRGFCHAGGVLLTVVDYNREGIAMHFCFTAQYTRESLNAIMKDPKTSRYEATKKLIEAGGGKLISMYSTPSDGPGVLIIFDVPDPSVAAAISGIGVASGAVHNVKLTRLFTQEEIGHVRQTAAKLHKAYKPPGEK
jgi:uncharacterized protein with GYD domain